MTVEENINKAVAELALLGVTKTAGEIALALITTISSEVVREKVEAVAKQMRDDIDEFGADEFFSGQEPSFEYENARCDLALEITDTVLAKLDLRRPRYDEPGYSSDDKTWMPTYSVCEQVNPHNANWMRLYDAHNAVKK